jgi:hypothetical protein
MARRNLVLAIASSLLAGGFLYYRFGQVHGNVHLYGWQWYQGAVLLAAIGLAGLFSELWQTAAIVLGLGVAPSLIFCYEIAYLHPAESMWPVVLPMVFLFSFPAPIIGIGIGRLLMHTRPSRMIYFVALLGALFIGIFLPNLTGVYRQIS